jgi:serine protease Do
MTKRTSVFTAVLIAIMSLAVGMVLASRLDLTPGSEAQMSYLPAANSDPISGALDATTFRRIAQAVTPAVVNIQTTSRARRPQTGADLFEQNPFFGNPRGQQRGQRPVVGSGTGFIIDKANGFILTNNHVVEGADEIKVGFFGDHRFADLFDAKVIGRDPLTDSALIQLTSRPDRELTEIRFGDSDQMAAGDWVMAIGNPFNLRHTVTVGVVSAVGRDEFQTVEGRSQVMIQTDAAINRGNSGGPMLNIRGEVVGINTAIYTNQTESNLGIGFAVPINAVRNLLPQLRTGRIVRGQLGVQVNSVPFSASEAKDLGLPNGGGAQITTVAPGSAAEKAGIRPNDIVIEFNGQPVRTSDELIAMVIQTKPGVAVPMKIVRNRQQQSLTVTVDELDLLAQEETSADAGAGTEAGGIGITIEPITPRIARQLDLPEGQTGAVVVEVEPGSAAERAGLAPGDVIHEVGGRAMRTVDDVSRAINAVPQGSVALLTVTREGRDQGVRVRKR